MKKTEKTLISKQKKSSGTRSRVVQKEIPEQEKYTIGCFTYNQNDHSLSNSSSKIRLTTTESALLQLLCMNMNEVLARETALLEIWGKADQFTARSMDVYITKLRNFFKDCPDIEIVNVYKKGHKLICNSETH